MKKPKKVICFMLAAASLGVSGCVGSELSEPPHVHEYDESVWAQDEVGHWHSASCGHDVRKDYGEHEYDGADDADCNVCGKVRKIEENGNPAESDKVKPEDEKGGTTEPAGFIIGENTDGLLIEGINGEYVLSKSYRAVDFGKLGYRVYLSEEGEKGKEVPAENYETTVYYGNKVVPDPRELTNDGRYSAEITLVNAYYADGREGEIETAKVDFEIVNGIAEFRFVSGKTEQFKSATDKMSGSWTYEAEYANGDRISVDRSKVHVNKPDTERVGKRTTVVTYAGIEDEVEYEIKAVPEIVKEGVEINMKTAGVIETDEEYAELSADDFDYVYVADNKYNFTVKTSLKYGNEEAKSVKLEVGGGVHKVTVRVVFEYEVEEEMRTKEYKKEFDVTVRKKPEETGGSIVLSGSLIYSGNGAVRLSEQDDFNISLNGDDVEISYNGEDFGVAFCGLTVTVDKAATVKMKISAIDGVSIGKLLGNGEYDDDQKEIVGQDEVTLSFSEAGEYVLYLSPYMTFDIVRNPIIIHGAEIIYE